MNILDILTIESIECINLLIHLLIPINLKLVIQTSYFNKFILYHLYHLFNMKLSQLIKHNNNINMYTTYEYITI